MKATIITIGDEILIGQIVDTNSASIARHLNAAGIVVAEKESVGDDRDAIVAALRRAMDGSSGPSRGRHQPQKASVTSVPPAVRYSAGSTRSPSMTSSMGTRKVSQR